MKILQGLTFFFFFLHTASVYPWAAIESPLPLKTHQAIMQEALILLKKDPAFAGSNFMPLEQIMEWEGVQVIVTPTKILTKGKGPDVGGASPYSYHYYNPRTNSGNGPGAASQFFFDYINPQGKDKAKGACWSAHFVADMSVPLHVVGMPREEAIAVYENNVAVLPDYITGPLFFYDPKKSPPEGWGKDGNFWLATQNYIKEHSESDADWYDPWYTNGVPLSNSIEVGDASHGTWEKAAHKLFSWNPHYMPSTVYPGQVPEQIPYNMHQWRNAEPDYSFNTTPYAPQAAQAGAFAVQVASLTRELIEEYWKYQRTGIDAAIRNVATLWRASFSGLRPQVQLEKDETMPDRYKIKCLVANEAHDTAQNVAAKVTVTQSGQMSSNIQYLPEGSLPPGGVGILEWALPVQDYRDLNITVEVIARYENIPDLQYAAAVYGGEHKKSIEGVWKLRDNGSVVRIVYVPNDNTFRGVLEVDHLQHADAGDLIWCPIKPAPVQPDVFEAQESMWDGQGGRTSSTVTLTLSQGMLIYQDGDQVRYFDRIPEEQAAQSQ